MKPVKTWILIANNGSARILENDGPGKGLFQKSGKTHVAEPAPDFSDQQGRAFRGVDTSRSKVEAHQKTQTPRHGFAGELVDDLISSKRSGEFDRLIICAPPAMLGQVRDLLPKDLQSDVIAELPKDLTHIPTDTLPDHFSNYLAV